MHTRTTATGSALGLALLLSLSACSTGTAETHGTTPAHDVAAATPAADVEALLVDLGLEGMTGKEVVEELERSTDARPLALKASVREDHLLVGDGSREAALPLPEDELYVSIAPFVEQTHDCYYHSLATCTGELADAEVSVLITDGDGEVLVDETVTTEANGFTGFWLPRGIEGGTVEVAHDGHEGSVPLATTPGSPTCLTTLQLEPAGA